MAKSKYDKYISKEIIEHSKYPQITSPMINYRGDRGGKDLGFQWSCITQPVVMDDEPEVKDVDQFFLFASSSIDDIREFNAEIELPLGKEKQKQIITEPTFLYVPAGVEMGPINFKSIRKPITLWNWNLDTKYSENWRAAEYSQYLAKPMMMAADGAYADKVEEAGSAQVTVTHGSSIPFRFIKPLPMTGVSCWTTPMGMQANLCTGYFVVRNRDYCCFEPVHYHRKLDEWLIFLGSNPLDIEDFDAEIEMILGKERERVIIDSTCVAHIPPGMPHQGQYHMRMGKPINECIVVAGTGDYYNQRDKVVISRQEDGEVMISEGAMDWAPVTRED